MSFNPFFAHQVGPCFEPMSIPSGSQMPIQPTLLPPMYLPSSPFVALHAIPSTEAFAAPVGHMFPSADISDRELAELVSKYNLTQRPSPPKLNISTIATLLSGYKRLIVSVGRMLKYLEVTKKTLSEKDWSAKSKELDRKRQLLLDVEKQISDPYFIELVQKTVKHVKSKRMRLKRKNLALKAIKAEMKEIRDDKHKKINLWLENMKDEVERVHREEMVKKEADLVLSEVTLKKGEAKRMLGLLNSLTKLRNAKLQQISSSNKQVSPEETNSFNLIIDKLKTMWAKQLKGYNLEEQGLKVMLNDAEVKRVSIQEKTWRQNLHAWTEALFGSRNLFDQLQAQPSDFELFSSVRKDWDQFIGNEDTVLCSCIPTGWVVPVSPSSTEWAKYTSPL